MYWPYSATLHLSWRPPQHDPPSTEPTQHSWSSTSSRSQHSLIRDAHTTITSNISWRSSATRTCYRALKRVLDISNRPRWRAGTVTTGSMISNFLIKPMNQGRPQHWTYIEYLGTPLVISLTRHNRNVDSGANSIKSAWRPQHSGGSPTRLLMFAWHIRATGAEKTQNAQHFKGRSLPKTAAGEPIPPHVGP